MSEGTPQGSNAHLEPAEKQALQKQIAIAAAQGESVASLAARLGISRVTVGRILKIPETQDLIRQYADESVQQAKNLIRATSERLAPKAMKAMEELLEAETAREKAEGVKLYFRAIGLEKEEANAGAGTLIVNFPGVKEEKAVETSGGEVE